MVSFISLSTSNAGTGWPMERRPITGQKANIFEAMHARAVPNSGLMHESAVRGRRHERKISLSTHPSIAATHSRNDEREPGPRLHCYCQDDFLPPERSGLTFSAT